jgi:PAS domain S-box-containing protein
MNITFKKYMDYRKKNPYEKMSVALFIIIAFIAVTIIMLTGFAILDYKLEKDRLMKNLNNELSVASEQLKFNLAMPIWNVDKIQIEMIIESSMSNLNIYGIIVSDNINNFIRSRGFNWEVITPGKEFSSDGLLMEKRDIIYSGETIGTLKLFGSTKLLEANLRKMFVSIMTFISIFVFVVIIGLYLTLHKIILKPVIDIEQYALAVSSGMGKDLKIKGTYFQGELDTLRSSIEKMVDIHKKRFLELQKEVNLRTESEERFRTIFNSSNDALLICDEDTGEIIHVNEKMCEMFGFLYNEATRNNLNMLSADETQNNMNKAMKEAKRSYLKLYSGELIAKKKNGDTFWAEISIKDTVIDNKSRALVAIRDITARKQAEEDRRLSEEKYRNIVEKSVEGIFQSTPEGKYLSVNPAMARIYGYDSPEDMISNITNLETEIYVDPKERMRFIKELDRYGKIEGFEVENYRKNNEKIWITVNARTVYDSTGKVLYYEGTVMDITLRKNTEEEKERLQLLLRQAQKMEAIGTLAGGVAHDFNNILSVVLGFGSMLQKELDKDSPIYKYADQIVLAAEKAANLTSSLLSFSRKRPVQLQPVKLNDIIISIEKLLITSLTEDITLQKFLSDKELVIMGDVTQIEQILFNLATNARDAMPDGGILTIETKLLDIKDDFTDILGYGKPGTYTLLSVKDTGEGMDIQTKEHIFDPFYTTKSVGKGTGLGLSTVYGIVKQHNGYITVYSEPGMGTVFHIYFPAISASIENKKEESYHIKGGNETILVAEDNENVRYFINTILTKWGYTVIEAKDGEDAVQKYLENENIELMIIDSVMPKKNGREVYDEIKKENPDVKVLFTSGYTKDIILDKGIEEKEVEFISKPIKQDILLKKIREILDSK